MRNTLLGVVGGVILTIAFTTALSHTPSASAQRPGTEPAAPANLLISKASLADGDQQIVVIDTDQQVIGSYHVSATHGEISLKSVRNIRYDMMMEDFNGSDPKPRDIRALLEQK